MKSKNITIEPITRLEGEGKISIFLNEEGNVENAFFQVVELRGFEKFCQGRPVEEMPRIVPMICGVCPGPHHIASGKAVDAVFNAEVPETAKKLRELYLCAHTAHSHILHFYALAAPDFVVGPDAPKEKRNILGLIGKVGLDAGKMVIRYRAHAQKIQQMLSGRATHSVFAIPGGVSKPMDETERIQIEEMGKEMVEYGRKSLEIFENLVLKNRDYVELIMSDAYKLKTNFQGLVDKDGKVAFYDGVFRVIDTNGNEIAKYDGKDYYMHLGEHVEPWSSLKFTYLKSIGWKGFVDGDGTGIYRVGPLARINVANGFTTPLANEEYKKFFEFFKTRPVQNTLAYHWARLIENLHVSERILELASDKSITGKDVRGKLGKPGEGVGFVEAPRGSLFHHYWADEKGLITRVNLLVATGHNNASMNLGIARTAKALIKNGEVSDKLLNMVEMNFRAYDPCLACATHTLPGALPITITIYDSRGKVFREIRNLP
ncbi:MAG: Ni/Fe hydrogenase subunit alpha [Thermoplasmata archaeon]|nr:Ni/Fe hydrogenase subunit alpha [Thermoplasmata archaeon]